MDSDCPTTSLRDAAAPRAELLEVVLEALPVGVTVTRDGQVVLANEGGRSESGEPGCLLPDGEIVHANGRARLVASRNVRDGGETLRLTTSVDVTDRIQSEEQLRGRMSYDELTGLPARKLARAY